MIIDIFYNKSVTAQSVAAWVIRKFYLGRKDSAGTVNTVTLHDVDGLATAAVDAVTYTVAATRHRIFNLTTQGTSTGQVSTAQITYLKTKLLGKTASALSDTDVISILPAGGGGRSLPEIAWMSVWNTLVAPTYTGTATSGAATTLTDSGNTLVADAFAGYYIQIISGTGIGQVRQIVSNTTTAYTVATWTVNPTSSSVYVVSAKAPRPVPMYIHRLGAYGSSRATGTATAGGATGITDSGATWVIDAFIDKYCFIYDGAGQGQYALITDNEGTSVTVAAWKNSNLEEDAVAVTDNTSKYIIVDNLYEGFLNYNVTNYFWTYMRNLSVQKTEEVYQKLTDCYDNIFNTAPDAPVSFDSATWTAVLTEGQFISDYLMKHA